MTGQPPNKNLRLLVVEGKGDEYFFTRLLEHIGRQGQFEFIDCEGKENLAKELANILNRDDFPQLSNIGIILDNDYSENRKGRSSFALVLDAILTANESFTENNPEISRELPGPSEPRVKSTNYPHLSVLVLPSDEGDGAVEDLVLSALPQDKVMDCVDSYFNCLCNAGVKANQSRLSKSKLSVYLSGKVADKDYARHDDAKRAFLTQAVEMKWWKDENMWDRPAFKESKDFLQQLLAD